MTKNLTVTITDKDKDGKDIIVSTAEKDSFVSAEGKKLISKKAELTNKEDIENILGKREQENNASPVKGEAAIFH